ncbi:polysaccharide biosynthesis tyrosine autokinase [Nakamurella alba]|nr:polysaccharide biosynthesis tyrosine autokinase [Nakamurella alba]
MDLRSYLLLVRKNWWLILLAALLGAGAGVLYNSQATRIYASSITFYISTGDAAGDSTSPYQANQLALAKVASYSELMSSDSLATMVIDKAGLDLSPGAVANKISTTSELNTVLLTATVTDANAQLAYDITTALSTEFEVLVNTVDRGEIKATVVSGPYANPNPVSPRENLNLALGVVAGLVLGLVLALLRGLLDTTLRNAEALRTLIGFPVLGTLGFEANAKKYPVLTGSQTRSVRAEAYRQLRTNLQFMNVDNPVQVLVVTSSVAGEGKSTTASNLAIVYAETGRKVLLIEADLRRGRVSDYLGLEGAVGLTNVLAGDVEVEDVVQQWGNDNLRVMLGGETPPNPSELLGSHIMIELIEKLREQYDIIVVDCPPLLPVTDAAVASTWADGSLLIVRYGKTTRSQVAMSVRALEAVDARILGAVLSMRPNKRDDQSKGYQGYGYYTKEEPVRRRFGRKASREQLERVASAAVGAVAAGKEVGHAPASAKALHAAPDRTKGSESRPTAGADSPSGPAVHAADHSDIVVADAPVERTPTAEVTVLTEGTAVAEGTVVAADLDGAGGTEGTDVIDGQLALVEVDDEASDTAATAHHPAHERQDDADPAVAESDVAWTPDVGTGRVNGARHAGGTAGPDRRPADEPLPDDTADRATDELVPDDPVAEDADVPVDPEGDAGRDGTAPRVNGSDDTDDDRNGARLAGSGGSGRGGYYGRSRRKVRPGTN